jgi:high-affinity K+ transport system ATPase subunit B
MSKQVLITEEGYEGKYVAMRSMSDRTIIASGDNPDAVMSQAHKQGVTDPVIFFVPDHDITLVY